MAFFCRRQITPVEGFVLAIFLAERQSDCGFGHFVAEIKSVRGIDVVGRLMRVGRTTEAGTEESFKEEERIAVGNVEARAEQMDLAVLGEDAVVVVLDLSSELIESGRT